MEHAKKKKELLLWGSVAMFMEHWNLLNINISHENIH
jgi:hypothetical protein